jgi:pilus assembly protein Flp/PilA
MKGVFTMLKKMKALFVEEEGQGMTEYGLVLGIIAVAVVGILALLREQIVTMFTNVKNAITGTSTGDSGTGLTTTP